MWFMMTNPVREFADHCHRMIEKSDHDALAAITLPDDLRRFQELAPRLFGIRAPASKVSIGESVFGSLEKLKSMSPSAAYAVYTRAFANELRLEQPDLELLTPKFEVTKIIPENEHTWHVLQTASGSYDIRAAFRTFTIQNTASGYRVRIPPSLLEMLESFNTPLKGSIR